VRGQVLNRRPESKAPWRDAERRSPPSTQVGHAGNKQVHEHAGPTSKWIKLADLRHALGSKGQVS
jgi:hypothetical protein